VRRRAGRGVRVGAAAAVPLLVLAARGEPAPGPEEAAEHEAALRARPEAADRLVALGVARAREGDLPEAERALSAAALRADRAPLAATAYYDLGVAALEGRDFETARDAFFDALALDPDDREAKLNLEWTLRAMQARDAAEGGGEEPERPDASREGPPPPSDESRAGEDERDEAQSAAPTTPDPQAEPRARPEPTEAEGEVPPPLDPSEAQRWLDAVQDDPGRALRRAASEQGEGRGGSRGPRW
jgi:tetratricopeptide (TPR) repeat protein